MELVFATNNKNKLKEIAAKLEGDFELKSLSDIGYNKEIPEDFDTLRENAMQKARTVYLAKGVNCFADDTGLEVEALDGKPGVYSARYAGANCNSQDNIDKLLKELEGLQNRKARFRTVIALILNDKEYFFEGIVNGRIIETQKGLVGFGYDPVFSPDGYNLTFAEMGLAEKNQISHRAIAFKKMIDFLKKAI